MSHLQKEKEVLILDAYLNDADNGIKTIANKLDVSEYSVHKVVNKYISTLKSNNETTN